METGVFFGAMIIVIAGFGIISLKRKPSASGLLIGLITIGYSLVYDIILGQVFGLYYYINPGLSPLFMVLSAVFVYAPLNTIYVIFLPESIRSRISYTTFWIIGMLIFEYITLKSGTLVFTGWEPIPWSIITYIVTYTLINLLLIYLRQHGLKSKAA